MSKVPCALFIHSIVDEAGLKPSEFRVLCHVARRGECFATVATTAEKCRLHPDTVRKSFRKLRKMNWLVAFERTGRTTVYRVNHAAILKSVQHKDTSHPYENNGGVPHESDGGLPPEISGAKGNPHKLIQLNEHYIDHSKGW